MKYNPEIHHRRSIRLKGYDYSQPGWYFVTICTENKELLFGKIDDGRMTLNPLGQIIDFYWKKNPVHFNNVRIDLFHIMPNHFHGIIEIVGAMHSAPAFVGSEELLSENASPLQRHGTKSGSLCAVMQNLRSSWG